MSGTRESALCAGADESHETLDKLEIGNTEHSSRSALLKEVNENTAKFIDVERKSLEELETRVAVEASRSTSPPMETFGKWQIGYLILALALVCIMSYIRSWPGAGGQDTTYTLMFAMLFVLFPWKHQSSPENVAKPATVAPVLSAAPHSRLFYLDNLKALMTLFVLMHHTLIGYGGSGGVNGFVIGNFRSTFGTVATMFLSFNQSYFMCLFMFISGYFVPKSLERKGTAEFMKDKFMRFGIPLAFFFFVLAPAIVYFNYSLIDASSRPEILYKPDPGPQWFVQNLLLFSGAYALCPGAHIKMSLPSTWVLLIIGAMLGFVQGVMLVCNFQLWNVPLAQGALPFDVMFFAGGCIASKNKWLDDIAALHGWRLWLPRLTMVLTVFLLSAGVAFNAPGPYHHCEVQSQSTMVAGRRLGINMSTIPWYVTVGAQIVFGMQTLSISICLLHWFAHHCNFTGRCSRFLSEGAFGAYILHPLVWTLISRSYTLILEQLPGQGPFQFKWCDGLAISSTPLSEIALFGGWLYTVFLSACVLWPLANLLRKLPGLNKVL